MRRLFWVALGATAGILIVRRVSRKAESFTPQGLADAVSALGQSVRDFAGEVREGMIEREHELRHALGIDGQRDLSPEAAVRLIQHPTGDD